MQQIKIINKMGTLEKPTKAENPTEELLNAVKVKEAVIETGKKKQATSTSYTLKAFFNNIQKLAEKKIVSVEDWGKLQIIYEKAVAEWIKNGMKN